MNGTSGFQEVQSSTSRLPSRLASYTSNGTNSKQIPGPSAYVRLQECIRVHPLLKEIVKFFVSLLIFGFLFSVSVQALAVCPNYQVVSPLEELLQQGGDWCTFAASRVITSHYGLTRSQCELVGDVVGQDCCTNTGFNPACHPDPQLWPHDVFNLSTVNFSYTPYIVTDTPLPWTRIVTEICEHNRPLLAVASYEGTTNWHAIVVEGYEIQIIDGNEWQRVRVFDPNEDMTENPTFKSYDYFSSSGYEHHTDYVDIQPNGGFNPRPRFTSKYLGLLESFATFFRKHMRIF